VDPWLGGWLDNLSLTLLYFSFELISDISSYGGKTDFNIF